MMITIPLLQIPQKMSETETIDQIQQSIIDDFTFFEDWSDKYEYIIQLGKELSPLDEAFKDEDHKVKGCQSQVWMHAYMKDDKVYYEAESDAIIVKGLIALLLKVYSGQKPANILQKPPDFIEKIGMSQHLSPTRSNGLAAMVRQIKYYALAFKTKSENEIE